MKNVTMLSRRCQQRAVHRNAGEHLGCGGDIVETAIEDLVYALRIAGVNRRQQRIGQAHDHACVIQTIDQHLLAIFVRPGRAFLRALLEASLYLARRGLKAKGLHRIQQALAGFLGRRAPRLPFRRFGWPDIGDLPIL